MNNVAIWVSAGLLLGIVTVYELRLMDAEGIGYKKGVAAAEAECKQDTIDELTVLIISSQRLTSDAYAASRAITQSIADRQQADRQTTRELRHALTLTAPDRAGCVYDADSLRLTNSARDRAAQAVTTGLGRAVPSTSGHDEQPR
ncbi:MAG: hypothetical protein CVV07_01130 [Gammaproteobacteria bacterium HGW-Gammaproteobacteria-11]|nr:MAG: hypothetical protein CVV07_01130 [Gammaproteobacteria bacterium HGW-Gammaproteobacteria-11]